MEQANKQILETMMAVGERLLQYGERTNPTLKASQVGWRGAFRDGFVAKDRSEAGESFFFNSDPYQEEGAHLIHSGGLFAPGPGAFPQTGEGVALTCKLFVYFFM